ncbi:transcription termination/antitermination NusG family protein, partial [Pedobacter sp.]|uniref:transcription termination/antitermination NusG family protein n=2 Tax=Sphingobacteriaceae TaxID=84566 RepID=UPI002BAD1B18
MNDQLKWYVVRAVSGKEKKVKQYIDSEISRLGFSHLVPQVLIPMEKYYQMKDGKKIAKERNFYPGYVLIEAILDGELEHIIKGVNSV